MQEEFLTTKQVQEITGWSLIKVRRLIHAKRLPASNTSAGGRATFLIRRSDLDAMLKPTNVPSAKPTKTAPQKPARIDSHVKDVFGALRRANAVPARKRS